MMSDESGELAEIIIAAVEKRLLATRPRAQVSIVGADNKLKRIGRYSFVALPRLGDSVDLLNDDLGELADHRYEVCRVIHRAVAFVDSGEDEAPLADVWLRRSF